MGVHLCTLLFAVSKRYTVCSVHSSMFKCFCQKYSPFFALCFLTPKEGSKEHLLYMHFLSENSHSEAYSGLLQPCLCYSCTHTTAKTRMHSHKRSIKIVHEY